MEEERFFIGPAYLSIEHIFDSSDKWGNKIKLPDFWKDKGEAIVWGYRISGSEVSFHSQVDYLAPDKLGYLSVCQYICDRMADLLGECLEKVKKQNTRIDKEYVIPADFGIRIYYNCAYLSGEEEYTLSCKLRDLFRSGEFRQANRKGGLSERLSQIKEIEFSEGGDSETLRNRMFSKKKSWAGEVEQHKLKTYQDYLKYKKQIENSYNRLYSQLDELDF